MDPDADPYPIVLRAWSGNPHRAAWGSVLPFLVLGCLFIVYDVVVGVECDYPGCRQPWILGVIGIFASLVVAAAWYRTGRQGLELRIDRDGFVAHGSRVPWGAVMSIAWTQGSARSGEHLEIRVRNIEGYRAPSDRTVSLQPGLYEVRANLLIDILETAALPRRVHVAAVEPPPSTR